MNNKSVQSAQDYEQRYKSGYGLVYPESHIIRVHRHILEWELGIKSGLMFDFGCGSGAHPKYFAEQGFIPYGCDTSETAVAQCKAFMPNFAANFSVSSPNNPDLVSLTGAGSLSIFLSNQVLYYLDNAGIRNIVQQAHTMLQAGGVFIASMMSYSCWYARHITAKEGDYGWVELDTPRQKAGFYINFKQREELEPLFQPFRKLHLGSYGSWIREEEGSTDHWLYVGVKD